jgi:hypothetical protein
LWDWIAEDDRQVLPDAGFDPDDLAALLKQYRQNRSSTFSSGDDGSAVKDGNNARITKPCARSPTEVHAHRHESAFGGVSGYEGKDQ